MSKIEEILAEKTSRVGKPRRGVQKLFVKWKGLSDALISWEQVKDLKSIAI